MWIYDPKQGIPERPAGMPPDMVRILIPDNGRGGVVYPKAEAEATGFVLSQNANPPAAELEAIGLSFEAEENKPEWSTEIF